MPGGGVVLLDVRQHLGVPGLGGHEAGMGAVGDDPTALEEHDPLGQVDRRQPVGDDERRPTLHQHAEGGVDLLLDLHVDGAGGVVEDEDGGVVEQRARDRDALPLTARQRVAALPHLAVEPLGERVDELLGARGAGRGPHVVVGRVGTPVGDVLAHAGREQERLVEHQADGRRAGCAP